MYNKKQAVEAATKLQDYFLLKITKADYEITKFETHTVEILIDEQFTFTLWIANGSEYLNTYNGHDTFMRLHFTPAHKLLSWALLEDEINRNKREVIVKQKRAELEKLENELKELNENK